MPVIIRWLKLTNEEYAHLQFVEGYTPSLHMPLDQNILRAMQRLAAYFGTPGPMAVPIEDEVRDAMEMVEGM